MSRTALLMAWSLLSSKERLMSLLMLVVAALGAAAQVAMVGAIFPFLKVLSSPEAVETSSVLSWFYDTMGYQSHREFLIFMGVVTILIIVSANMVLMARSYAVARFTAMRRHTISTRLARSYLSRDYSYFFGRNSGDMAKRVVDESAILVLQYIQPLMDLLVSGLSALAIFLLLIYVEPMFTLIGGGIVIVFYGAIYFLVSHRLVSLGEDRAAANERRFSLINDILTGIKGIKIARGEGMFFERFSEASREAAVAEMKNRVIGEIPRFSIQAFFFSGVILACLALVVADASNENARTLAEILPTLGVFAFAGQRMIPEIQKVYQSMGKMSFGLAALRNVHDDTNLDLVSSPAKLQGDAIPLGDMISLEDVEYSYPGSARASLRDISLTIEKGSRIGIVGGTGAGKTTLVDMLLGLLSPDSGAMMIDRVKLSDARMLEGWRRSVAYVPQDIFLVSGSVAENIALGVDASKIDHERVVHAARVAQIDEFVETDLPDGYSTEIGNGGISLSGGQRQRVGIARAIYQGAEFLVMDEATSALDTETERKVMAAIDALPQSITVCMIAHRLSTLRSCDRIIVMESGMIAEDGTWDKLKARRGGIFHGLLESAG